MKKLTTFDVLFPTTNPKEEKGGVEYIVVEEDIILKEGDIVHLTPSRYHVFPEGDYRVIPLPSKHSIDIDFAREQVQRNYLLVDVHESSEKPKEC